MTQLLKIPILLLIKTKQQKKNKDDGKKVEKDKEDKENKENAEDKTTKKETATDKETDTKPTEVLAAGLLAGVVPQIIAQEGVTGDAAKLFTSAYGLQAITPMIVDHIDVPDELKNAAPDGGRGKVELVVNNNTISPRMILAKKHMDKPEVITHELLHHYTLPFLEAVRQEKKGLTITDPVIKAQAYALHDNLSALYEKAKGMPQGYSAHNGVSVQDTLDEFAVNISNPTSAQKLKDIGMYDELYAELKRHIDSVTTLTISFTKKDETENKEGKKDDKKDLETNNTYIGGKPRTGKKLASNDKYFKGSDDAVFVFGSNDKGAHNGGNAQAAEKYFGAERGKAKGFQGKSYGIITTLKPDDASPQKENEKNTPEATIAEMAQLYKDASAYPEKNFYIAFTEKGGIEGKGSSDEAMNSGYTPREMAQMFYEARNQDGVGGSIPSNIHFHDKFLNLMKTS